MLSEQSLYIQPYVQPGERIRVMWGKRLIRAVAVGYKNVPGHDKPLLHFGLPGLPGAAWACGKTVYIERLEGI